LDEFDRLLFIYEHSDLASSGSQQSVHLPLWRNFHYLVSRYSRVTGYRWGQTSTYLPHRWLRANATVRLFDRIVEDRINVNQMRLQGGVWNTLADSYEAYRTQLEANIRCDFAHLQQKFIDFLATPNGSRFLNGDGSSEHPGIRHVLVDEYQDTNPIQEEIYLGLASCPPHNLCVVGDDDQSLYRFRGGTVECMVNFDQACRSAWGQHVQITQRSLSTNYRSQSTIVSWCDEYIRSFSFMTQPWARVANKPNLLPDAHWQTKQREHSVILTFPVIAVDNAQIPDRVCRYI
jgi:DNA helicase-2/ATP-dependent DNA helicase PcrA